MTPTISIVVPCYNQAQYLSEALASVINQEYTSWECIIVNDGSTDNTEEVAKEWVKKDNRIRYFYKLNSGVSDTRNFGIKQAFGKYILPLDGDDKISSRYISEALDILEKSDSVKLVYSDLVLFGAKEEMVTTPVYQYENMLVENQIFCSAIFRKIDFDRSDGYNTNMVAGLEDWDFWLSFLKKDDVVFKINDFHFYYRIKQISRSTLIDFEKNERLLLQMFRNHTELYLQYFNPIRDHINADFYKKELESYKNSTEYRLGSIFLFPYRIIQKIIKRIKS